MSLGEPRKLPTIYDVARLAGVSAATVSRVLNSSSTVDVALVEKVNAATKQLGYRRNAVARNLRRSRTNTIGVIIPDISNPFYTRLVHAVQDVAWREGYAVVLCNTDEELEKEKQYITNAISDHMAGVIVARSRESMEPLEPIVAAGIPLVLVDRVWENAPVDSVVVANEDGARLGVAHLIEMGYRDIACIAGQADALTSGERVAGYRQALEDAGRPVRPDRIRLTNFKQDGGHQAMLDFLDAPEPPDAVFVVNNLLMVGALEAIAERSIRMPEQLGLVGFDSLPWAKMIRPTLSVVQQPVDELGMRAGELLLARVRQPDREKVRVVLPATLSVGESSSVRAI
ncbi:MAG TPA: LacI family DNA-binding transcriptional regulator [Gryllotalpicola sp.]